MQVLAEAASREAELQHPSPQQRRQTVTKPLGSPMPRIHTLSKAQVAGVNQLTSKQAFAGQKILSQNLLNHKIKQQQHQHHSQSGIPGTLQRSPIQLQQAMKQMQQKQQKQTDATNSNILKSSSLANHQNTLKFSTKSNFLLTPKQQKQQQLANSLMLSQQQLSRSGTPQQSQRIHGAGGSRTVVTDIVSAVPTTTTITTSTNSKSHHSKQQHVLLKVCPTNKNENLKSVKVSTKSPNALIKSSVQQQQSFALHSIPQRNVSVMPTMPQTQQQLTMSSQQQSGCIKRLALQKSGSKSHAQKNIGIKTSFNTNVSSTKVFPITTNVLQQKGNVKTSPPLQPCGFGNNVAQIGQVIKIQPKPIQQKQIIMSTSISTQFHQTVKTQPGQIKTLLPINLIESDRENDIKVDIKAEVEENKIVQPDLACQSTQRRVPLPYECLQFVLQDHNYGAPPPPTPPPQSSPKHQFINGSGNSCLTAQHSYIFNHGVNSTVVEDDAASAISSEAGREVEPEGEETETAPEGEGDDEDSITRCICDFEHDDGYMICCDKCLVWQHVDCMGIDRANIPEEYLCELCRPRRVDRARARALQMRKREELLNSDSSSDISSVSSTDTEVTQNASTKSRKGQQQQAASRRKSDQSTQVRRHNNSNNSVTKRQRRDTHPRPSSTNRSKKETSSTIVSTPTAKRGSGKRKIKRRKSLDDKEEEMQEAWGSSMTPLRQWIEKYEEAVTNHYSPELRARISNIKINNSHNDLKQSSIGTSAIGRCRLNIQNNNLRFLVATVYLPPNTPVVELRGKYMLSTQHRPSYPAGRQHMQRPGPFVFFYRLPRDGTEVCVDTRTYGNEARFVRRSCKPNAEVKHCIEKGTLHLYIVTNLAIEKNSEITIQHDQYDLTLLPNPHSTIMPLICACNNSKDCQIVNLCSMSTNRKANNCPLPENADERERRRRSRRNTVGEDNNEVVTIQSIPTATINAVTPPPVAKAESELLLSKVSETLPEMTVVTAVGTTIHSIIDKNSNAKMTIKENISTSTSSSNSANTLSVSSSSNNSNIINNIVNNNAISNAAIMRKAVKEEHQEDTAAQQTIHQIQSSPVQSQSGIKAIAAISPITTNSSLPISLETKKDKKKMTREERKMEAIMKAFERLEKAEQRKQEVQARNAQRKESVGIHSDNEDNVGQTTGKFRSVQAVSERGPRRKRRKGRTNSTSSSQSQVGSRCARLNSAESDVTSGDESNSMQSPPPLTGQNCSYTLRVDTAVPAHDFEPPAATIPTAAGLLLALANSSTSESLLHQHEPVQQPQQSTAIKSPSGDSGASSSSQSSTPSTPLSSACLLVAAAVGPLAPGFKFPKTKKLLMNEWLKESPGEPRAAIEFAEQSSEFLSQNYAAKGLATLVQAAHSVSGICNSPPQRSKQISCQPQQSVGSSLSVSGSAKKRWLRQAISEECDSPNSNRPESPPSEMLAPPKKRRIARESLSSDNYTPPTTPTMLQQELSHRPSINEDDFMEHMPSPGTEDLGSQNEYDSDQVKDEIKPIFGTVGEIDIIYKNNNPVSLVSTDAKEKKTPLMIKIKEEKKSDDDEIPVHNMRDSVKAEIKNIKVEYKIDQKISTKIKIEPLSRDMLKIEKKSSKFEEVIEKGTVEIVDQNEQDLEIDDLNYPTAIMESDAELKQRVAELRLEFSGSFAALTDLKVSKDSIQNETDNIQIKCEEDSYVVNTNNDDFDVEAQMKKITGDDGDDYKEKVATNLEKDKNIDGIEGLMESSKEDSESEHEDRNLENEEDRRSFIKSNEKIKCMEMEKKKKCNKFESKSNLLIFEEEFKARKQSLPFKIDADDTRITQEIVTRKVFLNPIRKEIRNSESVFINSKDSGDYSDNNESIKVDFRSISIIPTITDSMMELDSMELPSENVKESANIFASIPPLSERIRKKVESNYSSKSRIDMEKSSTESSLNLETVEVSHSKPGIMLSTALRELEAQIEPINESASQCMNISTVKSELSEDLEKKSIKQLTVKQSTSKPCAIQISHINEIVDKETVLIVTKEEPKILESKKLKDPRTVVPNKISTQSQVKIDGPLPIKRKLSISEYRKRKQQSIGTPPEPENLEVSLEDKDIGHVRSSSASSGTSSLSSDDEGTGKVALDVPSLNNLPLFNADVDEKKGSDEGTIGWSAAPTLVERQRENLTERLKREFGLFLNDDEEEKTRKQGISSEVAVKVLSTVTDEIEGTLNNACYSMTQLPARAYIPPPGSAAQHYSQYPAKPSSSTGVQYSNYSVPPPLVGMTTFPPPPVKSPTTTSSQSGVSVQIVPQAPPGSNPYPPTQFSVSQPVPVPPPTSTTISISRFSPTSSQGSGGQPIVTYPLTHHSQTQPIFYNHPTPRS